MGPSATQIKNGLVGLKIHVQKSAGVNMHSSQWGDSPRFTPVSLLRIDMQAPRLALLPREKPGQWDSSQTCRDQDSLRTGRVTCLPACPPALKATITTLVCGMVITYFLKLQEKNGLELLEVGVSQTSVCNGNYTKMPNSEPLASCT